MKPFQKPSLTVPEQVQLLKNRNLTIHDEDKATRLLEVVSLFRLTPYMRPYQNQNDPSHHFLSGTTLQQITQLYRFDSELRSLLMEAIERVEIALRASISNHMSPKYGAHWHLEKAHFKDTGQHEYLLKELEKKRNAEQKNYQREIQRINKSQSKQNTKNKRIEQRKRDNYFRYYSHTYETPEFPPAWAILEELSLGTLSRLYKNIALDKDKKAISALFKQPHEVFSSWLHTLTFVRNICAHHARLWNRELAVSPKIPKKWSADLSQTNRRLFTVLFMLADLTEKIAPDKQWKQKINTLLDHHTTILNRSSMGFPTKQHHL